MGFVVAGLVASVVVVVLALRWRCGVVPALALDEGVTVDPISKLVTRVIEDAYTRGAETIHIVPGGAEVPGGSVVVSYRVDGALQERMRIPAVALEAVHERMGAAAGLPPLEPSAVQEGRIALRAGEGGAQGARGERLDVDVGLTRWSSPAGPRAVLRLLLRSPVELDLDSVELTAPNLELLRGEVKRGGGGVILVAGTAGSGRTTTLHALRRAVEAPRSIVHVGSDEYFPTVPGGHDVRTWSLDADVIVAGELQDEAGARLAFQAAQDGRLVLATVFAEDVGMAIARLVDDMHVSSHVLALCLRAVVAQRLCRRVCRTCKAPAPLPAEVLEAGITSGECFVATQTTTCEMCSGSGYKGRAAVHEVVAVQGELEAALRRGEASPQALQRAALASGMTPLRRDALLKVSLGRTDLTAARAALGGAWGPVA